MLEEECADGASVIGLHSQNTGGRGDVRVTRDGSNRPLPEHEYSTTVEVHCQGVLASVYVWVKDVHS